MMMMMMTYSFHHLSMQIERGAVASSIYFFCCAEIEIFERDTVILAGLDLGYCNCLLFSLIRRGTVYRTELSGDGDVYVRWFKISCTDCSVECSTMGMSWCVSRFERLLCATSRVVAGFARVKDYSETRLVASPITSPASAPAFTEKVDRAAAGGEW